MVERITTVPLVDWSSMLKGFISGCLMAGGLFNPAFGPGVQIILFIVGFVVFLDDVTPSGRGAYIYVSIFSLLLSAFITFFFSVAGYAVPWLVFIAVITAAVYLHRFGVFIRGS